MRDPKRNPVQPYSPDLIDIYKSMGHDLKLKWQKNGGKILNVVGTTGFFLTGIHACRKTYKCHDELVKNGEKIRKAHEKQPDDKKFERLWRTLKTGVICGAKSSKHYILDGLGMAASAYATSKGWKHEHHNYQSAAAMVGIIAGDFLNYRKNVIAEHGKDADRKYLTTKHGKAYLKDGELEISDESSAENEENAKKADNFVVGIDENQLRFWYGRDTTPCVWSESYAARIGQLNTITWRLRSMLKNSPGYYTVNDVKREFFGKRGDTVEGAFFGRVYEMDNPEHPEYGNDVNLHYTEDEDFMSGKTEGCWIIIDIDPKCLFERKDEVEKRYPNRFYRKDPK